MKGTNKISLTEQDLSSIMKRHMGSNVSASWELSEGWANTAYAVELTDGRKVVIKAAPGKEATLMRYEQHLMKTEVEVMRLIAQRELIPIPHIYTHDDTRTLIDSEFFIMEYVEGTPLNKVKDELPSEAVTHIYEQLGHYNRLLNEITGERFGYYVQAEGFSSSWRDSFRRIMNDLLADGRDAGVKLTVSYEEVEQAIEQHLDSLDEVHTPSLIHWDLWDGNVFVKDGEVKALIDFERAMWADPLMEYYFTKFSDTEAFQRGYGKLSWTDNERRRRWLYDLHMDLIQLIECAYRNYEDPNHITWATNLFAACWERGKAI